MFTSQKAQTWLKHSARCRLEPALLWSLTRRSNSEQRRRYHHHDQWKAKQQDQPSVSSRLSLITSGCIFLTYWTPSLCIWIRSSYSHISGWESVPLLRGQVHMFWLHSRLQVQMRPYLFELDSSTDGSTDSAGWSFSRLDLLGCFIFLKCYKAALSFRSELTEEVVFILAYILIRSNLNIRLPIATLSHAPPLCGN